MATSAVSDNITPRKAHCEESSSARAARVEFLSAPKSDTSHVICGSTAYFWTIFVSAL